MNDRTRSRIDAAVVAVCLVIMVGAILWNIVTGQWTLVAVGLAFLAFGLSGRRPRR